MASLDSREEIAKIDKENILGSVEALPDQCRDAWQEAQKVAVPNLYKDISNIIMTGMGGSGLGARVIDSVFHDELKYPLTQIHDYDLPGYTDHHSLVICSSYSGTTEETLENARQAIKKGAKWLAIGTGNELINLAREHNAPYYQIYPKHNPSNQPRMAIGYSVVGQLVLASKAGLFKLSEEDVDAMITTMKKVQKKNGVEVSVGQNPAKKLAYKLKGRGIFYVSARHLVGAMHTVNNQLNENAKNLSADFQLPELNHHLMEGLKHPETNNKRLFIFFANSSLYPEKIQRRFEITKEVVQLNGIETYEYTLKSDTKLGQAFELIQFGAYVNLYLSILYGQNPAPIPWVDYFKAKLAT